LPKGNDDNKIDIHPIDSEGTAAVIENGNTEQKMLTDEPYNMLFLQKLKMLQQLNPTLKAAIDSKGIMVLCTCTSQNNA